MLRRFLLFPAPPFPFSPLIVTPPALEEEVEEEVEEEEEPVYPLMRIRTLAIAAARLSSTSDKPFSLAARPGRSCDGK